MATLAIKSGTTAIAGSVVKGSFSYFSANTTTDLGPTDVTGFYSGVDAPEGGYTLYQIGGSGGWTAQVATDRTSLDSILILAGATGSTIDQRITWATNTNSVFINSGTTIAPLASYFVGGNFTTFTGTSQNYLIKLNSDGSKDTSFNIGSGFNNNVRRILRQSDGKILAVGDFTTFTGATQNRLIRLNTDGSKDTSFNMGSGFNGIAAFMEPQSDGKILVGGAFTTFNGATENRLIRLNSDGSKDTSFNIGSGFNNVVYSVAVQSDGKILVGGDFTTFTGATQNRLIRLNSDGSKDTSFNVGSGFSGTTSNTFVNSVVVQSDGKILAGGAFTTFTGQTNNKMIRLNSDGSKDTSFNIGTGFGTGVNYIQLITLQSDGKILPAGGYTTFSGQTQRFYVRLNSDGSKDTSFDIGTGFSTNTYATLVQSDGTILVGGAFTGATGTANIRMIRLNSNGSKDTSFNIGSGFSKSSPTVFDAVYWIESGV
jgi:uncharacterized delta-60 repeat protein